jgi:CBS domain containing-hemolysin-like protein
MLVVLVILAGAVVTLVFSVLNYSLRRYSRPLLAERLAAMGRAHWLDPTVARRDDLVFVTAIFRLFCNILVLLATMRAYDGCPAWAQYTLALGTTGAILLAFAVTIPHAIANHFAETMIALFVRFIHALRWPLAPVTRLMHGVDRFVGRVAGANDHPEPQQIEKEILSVVEEGQKEGVVDQQEREMIASVIELRETQVGQIMTARPNVVALDLHATLDQVKRTLEESGHSRIPVYDGTLDQIVGILYARDLLRHVGEPPEQFDLRSAVRPAVFVPDSKPLRDMLHEFRAQKVHIAVVLDEYGGTAGLVTIEDILEQLVGEITDEHEPAEPPMLKRIDEGAFEADARLSIEEANGRLGLHLPTDGGYETLGGFVSVVLGRIPARGTTFTHDQARFTILAAEPQRVGRVRIDLLKQPAAT